ncbi:MAG: response regulator [Clostridiales Family XIII bacterium]|jgi:signal transduction histidine kinase/CheY-like chemotaxis protein|nr:response regulator [Clostridiales Family XIII bacterium]
MTNQTERQGLFLRVPAAYEVRFEAKRLETNIGRMRGFAIYIVVLQLCLQVLNIMVPQLPGEGIEIPIMNYVILSLLTLVVGLVYWVLLTLAKRGKIKGQRTKQVLVQSLLYIYFAIQLIFCTFNVLSIQGLNSQIIMVLMIGLVPILPPLQSAITILASFIYVLLLAFFTQGIKDNDSFSSWDNFAFTDMRANFIIITCITIFISVVVYNLYVKNFLKSVELEEANDNLEATVEIRTRELAEQTLAAQAASAAKTRFLAGMGHELHTPLNAIIGMSQVAKNAITPERMETALGEIEASSARLLAMLNDVLDMSNIETGKLTIEKANFYFRRTVEEAANITTARAGIKGVAFRTNTEDLPEYIVHGDKVRLRQILVNLLDNAVKYTPAGGSVEFDVKADAGAADGGQRLCASFTVKDTGVGIPAAQQQKLFVAFEQGEVDNMKASGAGLGLAISQSLAGMMGSEITVSSEPGIGSTFSLTLSFPIAEDGVVDGELTVPDLTGKRILIVDDIEINRVVLKTLLAETNTETEEAVDGIDALNKFGASPEGYYDLIFMDIMMPRMDGNEATRNIRNLERPDATTIPIVALSANALNADVELALASGMDSHLPKPIDYEMIMRALSVTLGLVK